VTSPDIGDNTSTLLGVVQAESSKGSDQAHVSRTCWIIMMLLTRYLPSVVTILAQTFSGAISVLKALNIFILWVLCRHHICEVHNSHFMEELIGEIRKAQGGVFMSVCRRHSSSLHKMALEDLEFGNRALAVKHLKKETVGSFLTICIL
jgi:hypothetical protein